MKVETQYSLLGHNTFGIDVKCDKFIEYSNEEELLQIVKEEIDNGNVLHIGGGSNLLFLRDFNGTVLHSAIRDMVVVEESEYDVRLRVGAGVKWDDFVACCVKNNYYGVENLSYIPGEVGAAPVQNVGAYGCEAKDIIEEVEVMNTKTGMIEIKKNEECDFAYRHSRFKREWAGLYFVLHVTFRLSKEPKFNLEYGRIREALDAKGVPLSLAAVRDVIVETRKSKLPEPTETGSAGSFFKNPVVDNATYESLKKEYENMPAFDLPDGRVKIPAGWLIEQCGWKGKQYKNAGVYSKQALILVNNGCATGMDVKELSEKIISDVKGHFNIELSPEVCFIG